MLYLINIIALSTTIFPVQSQITPGEYELSSNVISESGSNETGFCSSLADSGRVCNAPLTSVLFDGIPTLPGLDGDMWARQLLTFNTSVSSASIKFNFTVTWDNNGITTYTGVKSIEVVLFNCPIRGIGTNDILILASGGVIDNIILNQNSTSCNYLVRPCIDETFSTTSQIITLEFNSVLQRIYVAEITFYANMNRQCSPVGPIITSVITTTTSEKLTETTYPEDDEPANTTYTVRTTNPKPVYRACPVVPSGNSSSLIAVLTVISFVVGNFCGVLGMCLVLWVYKLHKNRTKKDSFIVEMQAAPSSGVPDAFVYEDIDDIKKAAAPEDVQVQQNAAYGQLSR